MKSSKADNYQTTCQVNQIFAKYNLALVSPFDPPMFADQSSHNRSNVAASNPHDGKGQQSLVKILIMKDAEGMERTNQNLNLQHSHNFASVLENKTILDMTGKSSVQDDFASVLAKNQIDLKNQDDFASVLAKNQIDLKNQDNFASVSNNTILLDMTGKISLQVKYEAASKRSKYDLSFIKQYSNIIRNETIRLMISIAILVYAAKHLLGDVRTLIFFDLLDDELFHFGSPQAISYFLPNMAKSAVRLDVTSFFEHSSDIMNRIMVLLLSCPDRKILQQMPEPEFISSLQSVIVSFLSNNQTKRGQSDKVIRLIMVEPRLFVVAVGDEIPEDILVRFRHGDETVINRFVDAGLERMEIQDNRLIYLPYFPSNCRLLIYIPTENGSYWHKKDIQRDNRTRGHGR